MKLLHLTLLHGFVEADYGCLDLAKAWVRRALAKANKVSSMKQTTLSFTGQASLGMFEHRSSCTVVAFPDGHNDESSWLSCLYLYLRDQFVQCNNQETHSLDGWTPHVTLGVTGSSSAARQMQKNLIQGGEWNGTSENMEIRSLDIMKRGPRGEFQSIASFPFCSTTLQKDTTPKSSEQQNMNAKVSVVIFRLERACRKVTADGPLDASLHVAVSVQLDTALAGISDVDAIVKVTTTCTQEKPRDGGKFLEHLKNAILEELPIATMTFRPAAGRTILTVRIPDLPSADITVCFCDAAGDALDEYSKFCLDMIQDGTDIVEAIQDAGGRELFEA